MLLFVMPDSYNFKLAFRGEQIDNSVDAFEAANTILATSQAFQEVAGILTNSDAKETIKININAFQKGSFITDFLVTTPVPIGALPLITPVIPTIVEVGKNVMSTLKTFIEIRKALKGKPPQEVRPLPNGSINIVTKVNGDNNNITFNVSAGDFRALQDKAVIKNIAKAVEPLVKSDSPLEEIAIYEEGDSGTSIVMNKDDAQYLKETDTFQTVPDITYKGTVSKIDTKARSGYLDIQSKRLAFTYPKDLPQEQFEIMIESLKTKIQVYLAGTVTMDYSANPRTMNIIKVERDVTLFS